MSLETLKAKHALIHSQKQLRKVIAPKSTMSSTPKHITLIRSLYPNVKNPPLESTKSGRLSYMGQILHQLGLPTLAKDKKQAYILSDVANLPVHYPFSCGCNGRIVQTDLSTSIINTPPENEARIRSLLEDAGFIVTFIDK